MLKSTLLLLFLTMIDVAGAEFSGPMLVYIIAGQSNCVGKGDADALPDVLKKAPPEMQLYQRGNGFTAGWRPLGPYPAGDSQQKMYKTGPMQFGPEISLGHALRERHPDRRIGLIKCSVGGTSVLVWSKDHGSPEWRQVAEPAGLAADKTTLYPGLIGDIRTALAEIDGPAQVQAFVWIQAEKDSMHPVSAAAWPGRVMRLRQDLAADLGWKADLPLVVMGPHVQVWERGPAPHAAQILAGIRAASASAGVISASRLQETSGLAELPATAFAKELGQMRAFLPGCLTQFEGVGIMQRGLETEAGKHPNVTVVRSDDLTTHEGLHFDTAGQIELGKRIAQAVP